MNRFLTLAGLFVAFALSLTFFGQPAQSEADAKPARWEYRTETVEPTLLSQKLTEWGSDHWDVFSVERGDTILEQDGATKLKVINFQVTARRPLK